MTHLSISLTRFPETVATPAAWLAQVSNGQTERRQFPDDDEGRAELERWAVEQIAACVREEEVPDGGIVS